MASTQSSLFFVSLTLAISLVGADVGAPSPAPAGPLNLTEILRKANNYNTFIRLLKDTEVTSLVSSLLNNDRNADGLTVLAPTDAAFGRLRPGTLNRMDAQSQSELVLFHILPKYYVFVTFETTTNPVRTQASGQHGVCTVNVTTSGEQKVNVSSGLLETTLGKPLHEEHPLAVYSLDDVLLPPDMFGPGAKNSRAEAPTAAGKRPAGKQTSSSSSSAAATPDEAAPSREAADATAAAAAGRMTPAGWPASAVGVVAAVVVILLSSSQH
ncbi:hypothetical protein GUJ93_ZPchr0002g25885 [Zizania palustris]|uniref:FAS1 domain-containing protein n=1 Tax=Zizania palustris TaxID=103762 RepID=A0A8J5RQQ9_ZIZPA|nr:hypothetical protein GUJ93_ZPchr0002g25885 [Zizania palustris]